jgi:hypothetical protein
MSKRQWVVEHQPLDVVALSDPVVESVGHHPTSTYAETYWLPVIGPSALWTSRRLVGWLENLDDAPGLLVDVPMLAREIGLGDDIGLSTPIVRTLSRLVDFELAQIQGDRLAVRTALPPLAARHVRRLPEHLAQRLSDERAEAVRA